MIKKKTIILSTILLMVIGCKVKEKPKFLRVENIQVLESNSKNITLTADAVFLNPNDIGGTLKTDGIKVFINNTEMATISSESFDVPAREKFSTPLKTKIPLNRIVTDKSLEGLLGSIISKKIKVQYKGDIIYKAFGFSYTYGIDKTDTVKLKY